MTPPPWPEDEVREQAASWFVRMRGPDRDALKAEFEDWLASTAARRAAYNRIAARFSEAKLLRTAERQTETGRSDTIAAPHHRRRWAQALAALLGLSIALVTTYPHLVASLSVPGEASVIRQQSATIATQHGEIRTIRLADGSILSIDTDSRLTVQLSGDRRDLHLEKGRVRFDVAHEGRPFVVSAGDGTVTATGTLFDVAIDSRQRVKVVLMRGAVNVARKTTEPFTNAIRRLKAGEEVGFAPGSRTLPTPIASVTQPGWPAGMVDFDEAPLQDVLAEANRYARTPIIVPDPVLRSLRVSGRFSVRDADALAASLARLFDLGVNRSRPDAIVLDRLPG